MRMEALIEAPLVLKCVLASETNSLSLSLGSFLLQLTFLTNELTYFESQ